MKAWVCRKSGYPTSSNNFKLEDDYPAPTPKGNQLLIKVKAVGLNPGGSKTMYLAPFKWLQKRPCVPELEFSGEIAGGNLEGSSFALGDEVYGINPFPASLFSGVGALAEYTLTIPEILLRKPATISHVEAAALSIALVIPYWALVTAGGLKKDGNQRVFINGGSGGTGTGAIQIAKAFGAYVVSTCSPESESLVRSLGADETIDYRSVNLPSYLASHFAGDKRFDTICDCIGINSLYIASPTYLKPAGLYANIGGAPSNGLWDTCKFTASLLRNFFWPVFLGGTPRRYQFVQVPEPRLGETFAKGSELVSNGKFKAVIDSEFSLDNTLRGYERVLSGRAKGKVVIKFD